VATTLPSPGPPAGNSSNSVTVQHLGWPGTVTLTTNKTQVDSSSPTATLTATLSRPLASSYILSIYDDVGNKVISKYWYEMGGGTQLLQNVSPPEYHEKTYTAYVAKDAPSPGPPTLEIRTTSEVTVENLGWVGTITLASNRTQVDASNPTATLTATVSKLLTSGYTLSIYDDVGNRLIYKYFYEVPPTTRQVFHNVSPPLSQTRTYTAYIAKDSPTPGPPKTTVRAASSLTFASGLLTSETMEGVDLTLLSSLATDEEFALLLSAAPMATHAQGSSLSDQALVYNAERLAGSPIPKALVQAVLAGSVGGPLLWWLHDELDGMEAPPPAAPAEAMPIPAPPVITSPLPRSNPATFEDELTDTYLERAQAAARPISTVAAQTAARTCVALAAFSISRQALGPSIDGKHPCEALPIHLPGSTHPETTNADWHAITDTNPAWISLNYMKGADREASGLPRNWYVGDPRCPTDPGKACHEYPYYATMQSGPPGPFGGPIGATLQNVTKADHKLHGPLYGGFTKVCLGKGLSNMSLANGKQFLVIPMNFPGAPPTLRICT
jgi:hypothetical protein